MTAESTQTAPRSRRALLAGALGGLGVWAASAIGRAAPAEAAAGDPIRMGRINRAGTSTTELQSQTSQPVFRAVQYGRGCFVGPVVVEGQLQMFVTGTPPRRAPSS